MSGDDLLNEIPKCLQIKVKGKCLALTLLMIYNHCSFSALLNFCVPYVPHALCLLFPLAVCRCGLRAGYMELVNVDPAVMVFAETLLCTDISTPVIGQIALEIMVNPPRPGDPSHNKYTQVLMSKEFLH